MILVDTNVLSEVWHPRGSARIARLLAEAGETVRVSVITMGEIDRGIRAMARGARRSKLERYYDEARSGYGDRLLPVTLEVAEAWAGLTLAARRDGRVLHPADGLIAATARTHELALWTRNVKDFAGLGLNLVNPWDV